MHRHHPLVSILLIELIRKLLQNVLQTKLKLKKKKTFVRISYVSLKVDEMLGVAPFDDDEDDDDDNNPFPYHQHMRYSYYFIEMLINFFMALSFKKLEI